MAAKYFIFFGFSRKVNINVKTLQWIEFKKFCLIASVFSAPKANPRFIVLTICLTFFFFTIFFPKINNLSSSSSSLIVFHSFAQPFSLSSSFFLFLLILQVFNILKKKQSKREKKWRKREREREKSKKSQKQRAHLNGQKVTKLLLDDHLNI